MKKLPFLICMLLIVSWVGAVFIISRTHTPAAEAPPGEPKITVPTTTTTLLKKGIPKPSYEVITKNNDGVGSSPADISYWWHGKIDGVECILIEDGSNPTVTCDWAERKQP